MSTAPARTGPGDRADRPRQPASSSTRRLPITQGWSGLISVSYPAGYNTALITTDVSGGAVGERGGGGAFGLPAPGGQGGTGGRELTGGGSEGFDGPPGLG